MPHARSPKTGDRVRDVQAEQKEKLHSVMAALQRLPESSRSALLMGAVDGMAYEEIPQVLATGYCNGGWVGGTVQERARSRRRDCSRALRVREAARVNSDWASAARPSLKRRSPRTLGSRW
jgi:DNA-directed RNA polymerase specialized sigma24 family protein